MDEQFEIPSVEALRGALEALEWPLVKKRLDAFNEADVRQERTIEALRRANKLIFEYPAQSSEKKRAILFKELKAYFADLEKDGEDENELCDVIKTIGIAEEGYRQLVSLLSKTKAAQLSPEVRIAAAVARSELEIKQLFEELHKAAQSQEIVTANIRVPTEDGKSMSPDASLEHIVTNVAMTIQMEAHKNRWFDENNAIVIPVLPAIGEDDIFKVGSTVLLATLWKRWKLTEQRARLLGKRLRILTEEERPAGTPDQLKTLVFHENNLGLAKIHRIAAERMSGRIAQNLLEIMADPKTTAAIAKSRKDLLAPAAFISHDEIGAGNALSDIYSYNIFEDSERPGGLRLVEWIRGFSALKILAQDAQQDSLIRTRAGWHEFFATYGLGPNVSDVLIDRLVFSRSSRDLFDQPLLKREDGTYQLFAPAFASMSIAIVVVSVLSNLGVQLQKKGKGFEKTVRRTFEMAGLRAYSFKATRDGSEYEYDAVVPWGKFLFVFECKNRSLPSGNPIQEHYFDLESGDNVKQLNRLMDGLERFPDILRQNLAADDVDKIRVPVLLNCLPYSLPGKIGGVYFYDFSALSRFFKDGQIVAYKMSSGDGATGIGLGPKLWSGSRPTAEDFLAQLENPVQFQNISDSLVLDQSGFPLSADTWVYSDDFQRIEQPISVN